MHLYVKNTNVAGGKLELTFHLAYSIKLHQLKSAGICWGKIFFCTTLCKLVLLEVCMMTHRAPLSPTKHHPWTLTSDPKHVSVRRRRQGNHCQYRSPQLGVPWKRQSELFLVWVVTAVVGGCERKREAGALYLKPAGSVWSRLRQKGLCPSRPSFLMLPVQLLHVYVTEISPPCFTCT